MARIEKDTLQKMLRVYFIAGSINCEKSLEQVVEEAIKGGVTLFQFREKGEDAAQGEEKIQLAKRVQAVCKAHHVPFIINDDVELALAIDADGIHIGQKDETANVVRQKIGDKILGVSVHNVEEAYRAIAHGADYFGVGPIFPTTSKDDAEAVQGTKVIELIRNKGIEVPIVGIGGISANNASSVVQAGADGVSVISAISHAKSHYEAAKMLASVVDKALKQ